jgi:hypothetical protein
MPKVAQLQTQNGLDPERLIEAARSKLAFAKAEIERLYRERRLKAYEIEDVAREAIDSAQERYKADMAALDRDIQTRVRSAQAMIDLVNRMLNE